MVQRSPLNMVRPQKTRCHDDMSKESFEAGERSDAERFQYSKERFGTGAHLQFVPLRQLALRSGVALQRDDERPLLSQCTSNHGLAGQGQARQSRWRVQPVGRTERHESLHESLQGNG